MFVSGSDWRGSVGWSVVLIFYVFSFCFARAPCFLLRLVGIVGCIPGLR